MSFTFALNGTNDLTIQSSGKLLTVAGADEVRQRIKVALLHDYQEYFLDTPGGTPWYELILGSKDLKQVEAILKQIILEVPGVISIITFSTGISSRNVVISTKVQVSGKTYGTDIIDVILNLSNVIPLLAYNENYTYITDDAGNRLQDETTLKYIVEP